LTKACTTDSLRRGSGTVFDRYLLHLPFDIHDSINNDHSAPVFSNQLFTKTGFTLASERQHEPLLASGLKSITADEGKMTGDCREFQIHEGS